MDAQVSDTLTVGAAGSVNASALASGLSTSKWLARRAALPVGAARQRLAVAHRLAALPSVDAALTDGRIGYDHARVLTDVINDRNVDAITPVLDDLIDAAAGTVFGRWRADVTALAALLDPDGSHLGRRSRA